MNHDLAFLHNTHNQKSMRKAGPQYAKKLYFLRTCWGPTAKVAKGSTPAAVRQQALERMAAVGDRLGHIDIDESGHINFEKPGPLTRWSSRTSCPSSITGT